MKGLTDLVRWYHTLTLSNEFKLGQLDRKVHDDLSSTAGGKYDSTGTIDFGLPLQSAVVKRSGRGLQLIACGVTQML